MWPRDGTVLSVSSRALVDACTRIGLDTDAMLRAAGIARERLEDPDARLLNREVSALWAKAYELSGDPVLSLHAAEACPVGAYKVIDYIGLSARTVGEAFRLVSRYFVLVNTAVRLEVDERGDPVTFALTGHGGPSGVTRPYAEYCLAVSALHARGTTGVQFPLREVTFSHPPPEDRREHERIFGCPVRFEAGHNQLVLDRAVWETPTARAHEGILAVLAQHAELLLERLPRGPEIVERTRLAIRERLRGGELSLQAVARDLGTSARSLQRHLREHGVTFNDVAEEVRAATARLYLGQQDVSIAEVAWLVGFADQSAFHRAFQRWTGCTPAEARRRARQEAFHTRPRA